MKNWLLGLVVCCSVFGCSSSRPQPKDVSDASRPRLVLNAIPRQGFAPLRVSFQANLQGVMEENHEFYCQREEWDFGDGAVSSEQPHCETFTEGSKITTEFFVDHVYETPGTYNASFMLGDKRVRSGKVSISVIESYRGAGPGR